MHCCAQYSSKVLGGAAGGLQLVSSAGLYGRQVQGFYAPFAMLGAVRRCLLQRRSLPVRCGQILRVCCFTLQPGAGLRSRAAAMTASAVCYIRRE